jgi:hypothetical protein
MKSVSSRMRLIILLADEVEGSSPSPRVNPRVAQLVERAYINFEFLLDTEVCLLVTVG